MTIAKKKPVRIVFILRAFSIEDSPDNTTEAAEEFCQWLKELLISTVPQNGIEATVEYSISEG